MENQVSIIINGVRYDVIQMFAPLLCPHCDLNKWCVKYNLRQMCKSLGDCVFKKSTKSFEP